MVFIIRNSSCGRPSLLDMVADSGDRQKVSQNPEMQKVSDAADISVLFFSACANFCAIWGHFWAILAILGNFWVNLGNFGSFLDYLGKF